MFKIEKGIPQPNPRINSSDYPFADMEVGDSFAVDNIARYRAAYVAGKHYERRHDRKVMFSGNAKLRRIWRIK